MPRHPARFTITNRYRAREIEVLPAPSDALSAPTSDTLISSGLAFWPVGAAWGSPDGQAHALSSVLAGFTRVLLSAFEWLYARAFRLALESSAQTVSEMLTDWEQDHGLPEPCFGGDQPTPQRLLALRRHVAAEPVATPEDFIRLAADYGYIIEIEEPAAFRIGFSRCGGRHKTGAAELETLVYVRVRGASVSRFICGASRTGRDRLYAVTGADEILCLLRKTLPGWVTPIAKPWLSYAPLVTTDGHPIHDAFGNPLLKQV